MPVVWDLKAERDLLLAIVASNPTEKAAGTETKVKVTYDAVVEQMMEWGYDTNVSAVRQRLTKKLLRNMNGGPTAQGTNAATPGPAGLKMPASSKRKADADSDELEAPEAKKTKLTGKKGIA
ncbi:hypothetical protein DL766_005751 [Monosporascus sp. MC13-8B]|uniref:Uncharacterized protein n=1 Tax=Monosporascus cannonballus TaxID=155416 RepID=A0ABY0GU51_9PEZI|nr:hypothetical protein DL762_009160 [Monosporascus cannonballus]RYO96550.1 hypothetical protein DL763_003169 [Monosporascus cannonballus]RYP28651.1 hypothetical protein DL766_005751 [Monosporascus sp. MC13-8B]